MYTSISEGIKKLLTATPRLKYFLEIQTMHRNQDTRTCQRFLSYILRAWMKQDSIYENNKRERHHKIYHCRSSNIQFNLHVS